MCVGITDSIAGERYGISVALAFHIIVQLFLDKRALSCSKLNFTAYQKVVKMASQKFQIPEEYKTQLRHVKSKDTRKDVEILDSLTHHVPITSEKNVWTYWHSGVQNMPAWSQRNIINWVRLHGPDWTVRVLDTVPNSPNHALTWVAPEQLPEAFVKGTMTGPYVGPHSADFLRGAALYTYGGVWMDVGCSLFRRLDKVCWDQLADENSAFTVATPFMFAQYTANHFVASRKGDEFIGNWYFFFAT